MVASVPGVDQADLLHRGPRDDLLGQLHLARRGRAERGAVGQRRGHGGHHRRVRVPEDHRPPGAHQVDVLAAVHVGQVGPDPRTMNRGTPPTAPNARTGEFTPPGVTSTGAGEQRLAADRSESRTEPTLASQRRPGTRAAAARPAAGARLARGASARPGRRRTGTAGRARSCPGSASAGPVDDALRLAVQAAGPPLVLVGGRAPGHHEEQHPVLARAPPPGRRDPGRRHRASAAAPAAAGTSRTSKTRPVTSITFASGRVSHQLADHVRCPRSPASARSATPGARRAPGSRPGRTSRPGPARIDPAGAAVGMRARAHRPAHGRVLRRRRAKRLVPLRRPAADRSARGAAPRRPSDPAHSLAVGLLPTPSGHAIAQPTVIGLLTYRRARTTVRSAQLATGGPYGHDLHSLARHLGRPVGQDDARARPADRGEGLHDRPVPVQPAVGRRRLDHRELAADLVRGHRHAAPCPRPA